MDVINIGTNDDGSPRLHYNAPGEHIVLTGAAQGTVTTEDGSVVDVSPPVIALSSEAAAQEVAALIDSGDIAPADPNQES